MHDRLSDVGLASEADVVVVACLDCLETKPSQQRALLLVKPSLRGCDNRDFETTALLYGFQLSSKKPAALTIPGAWYVAPSRTSTNAQSGSFGVCRALFK